MFRSKAILKFLRVIEMILVVISKQKSKTNRKQKSQIVISFPCYCMMCLWISYHSLYGYLTGHTRLVLVSKVMKIKLTPKYDLFPEIFWSSNLLNWITINVYNWISFICPSPTDALFSNEVQHAHKTGKLVTSSNLDQLIAFHLGHACPWHIQPN